MSKYEIWVAEDMSPMAPDVKVFHFTQQSYTTNRYQLSTKSSSRPPGVKEVKEDLQVTYSRHEAIEHPSFLDFSRGT